MTATETRPARKGAVLSRVEPRQIPFRPGWSHVTEATLHAGAGDEARNAPSEGAARAHQHTGPQEQTRELGSADPSAARPREARARLAPCDRRERDTTLRRESETPIAIRCRGDGGRGRGRSVEGPSARTRRRQRLKNSAFIFRRCRERPEALWAALRHNAPRSCDPSVSTASRAAAYVEPPPGVFPRRSGWRAATRPS